MEESHPEEIRLCSGGVDCHVQFNNFGTDLKPFCSLIFLCKGF